MPRALPPVTNPRQEALVLLPQRVGEVKGPHSGPPLGSPTADSPETAHPRCGRGAGGARYRSMDTATHASICFLASAFFLPGLSTLTQCPGAPRHTRVRAPTALARMTWPRARRLESMRLDGDRGRFPHGLIVTGIPANFCVRMITAVWRFRAPENKSIPPGPSPNNRNRKVLATCDSQSLTAGTPMARAHVLFGALLLPSPTDASPTGQAHG